MTTETLARITHEVEQLTPEEQAQLAEYLEDLADIRAANEAKARLASGEDVLIPVEQAIAESEAIWAERDAV